MLRNLVRLGLQGLERQKILEDSGDDTAFSFHSIDNGQPGTSAKQEKKKKTGLYLYSRKIKFVVGFEGEG